MRNRFRRVGIGVDIGGLFESELIGAPWVGRKVLC